jgi:hypothetical protein
MTAVTAGNGHTCALTSEGGVKCWGQNIGGQLGDGSTTTSSTPVDVVGLDSGVTAIAAGDTHTCALTTGGGVKCWGWNDTGQLGDGSTNFQIYTPVDVTGLTSGVTAIAAGYGHTCALISAGVTCWGWNREGQLGDATTTNSTVPIAVLSSAPPAGEPATPGPQDVVQAFYDWYLTDQVYDHLLARPDLSPTFIEWLRAFSEPYSPIVCAQGLPDSVQAGAAEVSGSSATVPITISFSTSPGQPGQTVSLTLGPGGWQISAVNCGF